MPWIDSGLAVLAFALAYVARYQLQIIRPVLEINATSFDPYWPYAIIYVVWLGVFYRGAGLYRVVRGRPYMEEFYTIINGVTNATLVVMALSFVFQPLVFSRLMMMYAAVISVALLAGARVVQRMVQARQRARGIGIERVLIVGAREVGQAVLRTMLARKELGYFPVGFIDDDTGDLGWRSNGQVRDLGGFDRLADAIASEQVDLVVITLKWAHHDFILRLIETSQRAGARVRVVPDLFQLNLRHVQIETLDGIPLLGVEQKTSLQGTSRLVKRAIDLVLIALCSPLIALVFGVVALAIRLEGPGPILYSQKRVGEGGRLFDFYKFRSMIPDADRYRAELVRQHNQDPRHPKIIDDPRVTRVGRWLRKTSLDELPNLINVVRGEMSLVGPRPPTPDEVALYEPWHRQRLQAIPGLTGLWQVSGRSDVPFDEMCLLDIYYIENWSIRLDAQILMMTVPRVLFRQGAY
jgi:exopolysaccharide biosynthesis polyprenyl glycosylphosphotransferase